LLSVDSKKEYGIYVIKYKESHANAAGAVYKCVVAGKSATDAYDNFCILYDSNNSTVLSIEKLK
jgi:hypothetical protein